MDRYEAIVVGGGASGLSFAHFSAASGRETLVLEAAPRLGGCIQTARYDDGFWFELGAHTGYSSYGTLIWVMDECGLLGDLLPRARVPFKLLRDGKLVSVQSALNWFELLRSLPRVFTTRKEGRTVYGYYSRLVGRRNYGRVMGPFLSAVPSQNADAFPANMLFKRRPRRKDVLRSFTIRNGFESLVEVLARRPRLTVATAVEVRSIARDGRSFRVVTADGREYLAATVAVAVPPPAAASMLRGDFPELAEPLARVATATVETIGVAVAREKLSLEPMAGIVPADDIFFSAVTRDTVPGDPYRGFAFHFKPGHSQERRL